MRHADDHFLNTQLGAALQNLFNCRNDRFCAIHAEPLGAGIFLVKILLEFFGIDKALIDGKLAALGKIRAISNGLDPFQAPEHN